MGKNRQKQRAPREEEVAGAPEAAPVAVNRPSGSSRKVVVIPMAPKARNSDAQPGKVSCTALTGKPRMARPNLSALSLCQLCSPRTGIRRSADRVPPPRGRHRRRGGVAHGAARSRDAAPGRCDGSPSTRAHQGPVLPGEEAEEGVSSARLLARCAHGRAAAHPGHAAAAARVRGAGGV